MKIDMELINDLSLTNIVFNTQAELDMDEFQFLNLIFAREGAFICIKSEFGCVFDKTSLPYKNKGLYPLYEEDDIIYQVESFIPKPDITVLEEILEFFKYVCGKTNEELLVIVYYDSNTTEFITDIVGTQLVSAGAVKYAYNKKYEMSSRYIKYLEIHSHHTMAASFSGTDNNDESNRTLYFCGVLGKINHMSNVFNVDHKFRVWSGLRFIDIPIYEVFETHTENVAIAPDKLKQLDGILELSQLIKDQRSRNNQTPSIPFNPLKDNSDTPPFSDFMHVEQVKSALEAAGWEANDIDDLEDDELVELWNRKARI